MQKDNTTVSAAAQAPAQMPLIDFLKLVLPEQGKKCVVKINKNKKVTQYFFDTFEEVTKKVQEISAEGHDAYFACALFKDASSRRGKNAAWCKSFWLDVDLFAVINGEKVQVYADAEAAIQAVDEFADRLGLPFPLIVRSGAGVHAYWLLREAITRDVWLPIAKAFKAATEKYGLHADPSRTADIASILRPPGTYNYKREAPALVYAQNDEIEFISAADFLSRLQAAVSLPDKRPTVTCLVSKAILASSPGTSIAGGVPEGGRNNACAQYVGGLIKQGMTQETVLAETRAWNQKCKPPMEDAEVQSVVSSILRREAEKPKNPFPYGYSMRADGLYWDNPGSDEPPIRLSSLFEIVAETRDAQGEAWGILLRWKDPDGQRHEWAMPRSMLAGDATDVRARLLDGGWHIAPNPKARNLLTSFFTAYRTDARVRCVERAGWHGKLFVTPGHTYGDTKDEAVTLQTSAIVQECKTRGTVEGWRNEVAAPAAGNSRLVFAIASSFAGTLLYLLGEESGGFHITGQSSIGKTTALHAAASVWGCEHDSWRTTDNAAENLASRCCDALLALDEIGQADPRCVEALSYLLSNGQGKKRMKRDGGARKDTRWRVLVLSTGEVGLAEKLADIGHKAKAGQSVRLLEIPADAGAGYGMFKNLHGEPSGDAFSRRIKEAAALHSGHAAPLFLEHITSDSAKTANKAAAIRKSWLEANMPSNADGQVSRAAGRFALVAAAGELAINYGILPWAPGEAAHAAGTCFQAWITRRGGVGSAEIMQGIAQVRTFLEAHGASRFETIIVSTVPAGGNNDFIEDNRVSNRAGFRKKNEAGLWEHHILPEIWRTEVCKGYDASAIAKEMKAKNMMITDSGRNDHSFRIPGHKPMKVYSIAASFFEDSEK